MRFNYLPSMRSASENPASAAVVGILWMLLSSAFLATVAVMGRYAGLAGFIVFQVVFLRLVFAAVALTPVLMRRGRSMLRTDRPWLYLLRASCGLIAMTLWFAALAYAPVGEVTAIGFLTPLMATAGAGIVLNERVDRTRWLAAFAGFFGALVILRPGFAETNLGTWLALAASVMMAVSALLIKMLTARDDPDKVVLISTLIQCVLAFVPACFVWQSPPASMWAVFVGMGLLGMLGHITLARSLRAADASIVLPVEFARLPFAVGLGFIFFDELIDVWTAVGGGIIFAAFVYSGWHERRADAAKTENSQLREPL